MVKNTGGNKSKKVARKNAGSYSSNSQEVRRVNDPCEMYAAVTKIYSSRSCDVTGTDGKTYKCNVRGKFLKNKRAGNNALVPGVWIIIGFYDWEVRGDGSKTCDLLEIYSPIEKEKLKQLEAHNLAAIMNIGEMEGTENEFTFSKFKEIEEEENIDSSSSEEEAIDKEIIAPASAVEVKPPIKTTINEQMDWLTINERDI
jgi:hypothetical protein